MRSPLKQNCTRGSSYIYKIKSKKNIVILSYHSLTYCLQELRTLILKPHSKHISYYIYLTSNICQNHNGRNNNTCIPKRNRPPSTSIIFSKEDSHGRLWRVPSYFGLLYFSYFALFILKAIIPLFVSNNLFMPKIMLIRVTVFA